MSAAVAVVAELPAAIDRKKEVLAARQSQSAKKAQTHNRARSVASMHGLGETGAKHRAAGKGSKAQSFE